MYAKYSLAALLATTAGVLAHPGGPRIAGRRGFLNLEDLQPLVKRAPSPDGSCGGPNAYTCGETVNRCCSQYGYCGDTDLHCQTSENCQAAFGICVTTPTGGGAGRCGRQSNGALCPTGQCCSEGGYCGTTKDHCMSPLCQVGYGICDADTLPSGGTTEQVARPHLGNVPYGIFDDCVVPGDVALTFDDGPGVYTNGMVDLLDSFNAKATFYITGINNGKGAIDTTPAWTDVIRKMNANGHQIASHTWSHADLSTLSEAGRRGEMIKLEMALRNILGFFPTYMRPPYSSCNAACVATMGDLGYHITYFDLDTDDYNQNTPEKIQVAKNNFDNAINPSNPAADAFLAIAHDIHQTTAQNLTEHMLKTLQQKGYKAVTVGECMGDPKENWYRAAGPGPSFTSEIVTHTSQSTTSTSQSSTSTTSSTSSSSSSSSSSTTSSSSSSSTTSSSSSSSTASSSSSSSTTSTSSSSSSSSSSTTRPATRSTTTTTSSTPTTKSTSLTSSTPTPTTAKSTSRTSSTPTTTTTTESTSRTSSTPTTTTKSTSHTSSTPIPSPTTPEPPTTTTSSTATSTPPSPTSSCAYLVGRWCAEPLPTYNNVEECIASTNKCWKQGNYCWLATDSIICRYYLGACLAQEEHCSSCQSASSTSCAYVTPVYPTPT
ncbi:hypothetical protein HOY80DRAFT_745165 [Tuber brumale]|nr:hypothetical protein HOY80DRAFT_745165 [Tuber brumale]